MTSTLGKVRQRLQVTTRVLLHGPGALPRRRGARTSGATGVAGRRRLVEQEAAQTSGPAGRHRAFVDAGAATPRTARDRFAHALSTDLGPWQALAGRSDDPDAPSIPAQIDVWDPADPLLGVAGGCFRVRLVEPGTSGDQVVTAALSGTPMIALPEAAASLPERVRDLVTVVHDAADLRTRVLPLLFQDELFDRASLQLRRRATRRLAGTAAAEHLVSAVVPTNRPHRIAHVLESIARQAHPVELVLVLHGLDVDVDAIQEQARAAGVERLTVLRADATSTLGACMNLGVDAASGRYVAKMDDDNHYAPEFLGDLVDAMAATGADIVGKWAHYVWLRATDAVVLRYPESEHRPERRVQGGAMLFRADVVRGVRFSDIPRAVDSDILDRAMAQGHRVHSADRYNYVSIRGNDASQHTWQVGDESFLTRAGTLLFFGDPTEHVTV